MDAQVAPFAHKVGLPTVDRLVEEAIGRFMPEVARDRAAARADGRRVQLLRDHTGTRDVTPRPGPRWSQSSGAAPSQ